MSSLTIEQLKQKLVEHGVELPASSARKNDYVQLYEQFVAVTSSRNDIPSSESDNKDVSSTDTIVDPAVAALTDDELFAQLQEAGLSCGPILMSTRQLYQKRLTRYNNGTLKIGSNGTSEEVIERRENENPNVLVPQKPLDHMFVGGKPILTTSYIEKVSRTTGERTIQQIYDSSLFDEVPHPYGDSEGPYKGRWSPQILPSVPIYTTPKPGTSNKQLVMYGLGAMLLVVAVVLGYYQWATIDPYKLLEDDVEKELQGFTAHQEH